jgi:hypothetical protein
MTEQKLPVVHDGTVGRPPYSDAVRKKILANLKRGNTRTAAVGDSGIDYSTFARWLNEYPEFREAVDDAEATAERLYAGRLALQAAKGDTRAITFWLERRRPQSWRERSSIDVGVAPEEEVEAGLSDRLQRLRDLADEALRRAARGADDAAPVNGPDGEGPIEPA